MLRERGAGKATLIPISTFCQKMGAEYPKLSATDLKLINPAPVPRLLGDKALQYWELYETPLTVPPWQPFDRYVSADPETAADTVYFDYIDVS